MINLAEYRKTPNRLADRLPWAAIVRPGTILNKDGSFQKSFAYRGPDLDAVTEGELSSFSAHLNNILKRFGSGWAVYSEAQRVRSDRYPQASFPAPVPFLIDEERRALFEGGTHYETNYYLTFVYLTPPESENKIKKTIIQSAVKRNSGEDYRQQLKYFESETTQIRGMFEELFSYFVPLNDDETLTYLHSTVSPKKQKVSMPHIPMYLDAFIADTPLVGGFEPLLGDHFLGVTSILGFPGRSLPGVLDDLGKLNFEYRWSSRWIPLDKVDALSEIDKYKKKWFSKRKGITTIIKELVTNSESVMQDSDAINKAGDAEEAKTEVADDLVSYGYYTSSVVVLDQDPQRLEKKLQAIERIIIGRGLTCIRESMNAVEAFLSSIPCICRANVRRPLLSSYNIAHIIPTMAVWAGPTENKHLKATTSEGAPIMHTLTGGSTPFRLSLHVGDVGHAMIIGPTGAGKTVFLNALTAQFMRYPKAQVYTFDKGYTAAALIAGIGGDHYDIGGERGVGLAFQPLLNIDNENDRRWSFDWTLNMLRAERIECDSEIKKIVWTALCSLATAPAEQRTITGLVTLTQKKEIRDALHPYAIGGAYGSIFDADYDGLSYGRIQCFEMEHLMNIPQALPHALDYLFHRIEARLSSLIPTLIILDEAWIYLDNPLFAAKIREWLKVLRKANTSVIFATQSLADAEKSSILVALIESCPTKIFLPNPDAEQENIAAMYRRFGLNNRELNILAYATKKRHYYYKSSLGSRLFELGLDKFALAYCGASREECEKLVPALLKEHGKNGFNNAWLRHKGEIVLADMLQALIEKKKGDN
ncbi:MAG: conjugal transfer protein TrbE [Nitrospirae bacterium]|nr:conjugal transfer protein TrbE [Nitrospirota bacterium]